MTSAWANESQPQEEEDSSMIGELGDRIPPLSYRITWLRSDFPRPGSIPDITGLLLNGPAFRNLWS